MLSRLCVVAPNSVSSGIAPAKAETVRTPSMILWRRPSGSFENSARYPAASLSAEALTLACSLAPPLPNVPTCSAPPSVLARCSTWRDITSSTLPRDGLTNTGRQKIKRTFNPYWHTRPTTMSWIGSAYPAVLLISGDADTRCNPMHARKMAARLQAATSSTRPVLLDYKPAWGHTPVQPFSTKIEALTDRLAFVCHELGVHVQPGRSL